MHVMMVVAAAVPCFRQFALADRAVAITVELGEHRIGVRRADAGIAERGLEFRLADLPVAIGVELGEQLRRALRGRAACRLTLQQNQRGHRAGVERGIA
ncbi:MAG: hypothetical protein ABSF41_08970 [Pseudolabrys sp.]|jgi:hypothetical protein